MSERSSLTQNIQIGVESVHGTSVAATKRLQSIGIEPSPNVETSPFRPIGSKFNSLSTLGKEWVTAGITGRGTYTELQYLLSSIMNFAAPVTAAGVSTWTFSPANRTEDTVKTFTVEHGSGVRADKFTYGLVTEFGMTINRSSIDLSGSMMGRALQDGITMTNIASDATVPLVPILPTEWTVYLDDDSADFGTTKLTRLISAELSLGSRFGPVWVVDAANPSFVNHVETAPDLTTNLTLQADSQGMGLLPTLRDGDTKFLRMEAIGGEIGSTGTNYQITIDQAVKIADTGGFSDQDGVYAIEFTGLGVYDGDWDKAIEVTLVNDQAAL